MHKGISWVHQGCCFGTLQLLEGCRNEWELQATTALRKEQTASVSGFGQSRPLLQESGHQWVEPGPFPDCCGLSLGFPGTWMCCYQWSGWFDYIARGCLYCQAAALGNLVLHPWPLQPLGSTVQYGLTIKQQVLALGGRCSLQTGGGCTQMVWLGDRFHNCVHFSQTEGKALHLRTYLDWKGVGGPLLSADNSKKSLVQVGDSCYLQSSWN